MTSDALRDALKRGLDLHKSARLDEALTWYRAALAIDADAGFVAVHHLVRIVCVMIAVPMLALAARRA